MTSTAVEGKGKTEGNPASSKWLLEQYVHDQMLS